MKMKSPAFSCAAAIFAAGALATTPLPAQNAKAAATAHSVATRRTTTREGARGGGCVKLPDLSPKIPAVPAGAGCARALYTLTTVPDIRIDYAATVEGDLAKNLGIEPASFTLAYIDTKTGEGPLAQPRKYYTVKYVGYLADGTVFDASANHPETAEGFTFPVGGHQVVAGWDTGFAGMRIGGKRRLFIPFQLAYGPQGRPPTIPARAELIFDMELVSQSDTPPAPKAPPAPPVAASPRSATPTTPPPASSAPATPPATESK